MTAAEKTKYGNAFPNLNVNNAVVTDDETSVYNCIAWTVGIDWRNCWPGYSIAEFDVFYNGYGYTRASTGPIAVWANGGDTNRMTHGSISGPAHGPRWESKCGAGLRFQHGLNELQGALYGQVVAYYATSRKKIYVDRADLLQKEIAKHKEVGPMLLSEHQQSALRGLLNEVPKDLVEEFESRFQAWKTTWYAGYHLFLSDPAHVKNCEEFFEVAALGSDMVPLLIEKLVDPKNTLALQLYDEIQTERYLQIPLGSSEEVILKGEEFRAEEVVRLFLSSL